MSPWRSPTSCKAKASTMRVNAECMGVARQRRRHRRATSTAIEGAPQVVGSHLLLAIGRRPNTDDLGLDTAGIAIDDARLHQGGRRAATNVPGIWALGDCNGRGAFTHTVLQRLRDRRGQHARRRAAARVSDRIPAYALYTDPPLGRVGMTEAEVRKTGRRAHGRHSCRWKTSAARSRRARRRAS